MNNVITLKRTEVDTWRHSPRSIAMMPSTAPASDFERYVALDQYTEDPRENPNGFEGIVGSSSALSGVLDQIRTVAPTDSTVLIAGETGTGKELIAQAIHSNSRRLDRPFVKLNCAAIPLGLLESELFGHEKGAFTGAVAQKLGRFEAADGGTLFLDEIGDIPLELQAKLLRVLEIGEMERVGSSKTKRVDVRVISATNAKLPDEVQNGRFRQDLLFRLNTIEIHIPALRERREDIAPLASHFLGVHARRYRKSITGFDHNALQAMHEHTWQGNVRELNHVVERAGNGGARVAAREAEAGADLEAEPDARRAEPVLRLLLR